MTAGKDLSFAYIRESNRLFTVIPGEHYGILGKQVETVGDVHLI